MSDRSTRRADDPTPGRRRLALAITYVFPPAPYVGAHRVVKNCVYLPEHGWDSVVLTAPEYRGAGADRAMCAQVPGATRVIRTWGMDPGAWLRRLWRSRRRPPGRAGERAASPRGRAVGGPQPGVLGRTKRLVRGLLFASPDPHIFWAPFAILRGILALSSTRVDVVYSSSPPHSVHLVTFVLATLFRKPYVLDFRDPWELSGPLPRVMASLRRVTVRRAARVVVISEGERLEFLAECPEVERERVVAIPNGFDPSDFAAVRPAPAGGAGRLRLSHIGTIHSGAGDEFFQALDGLLRDDPSLPSRLEVSLVGHWGDEYDDRVHRLERAGLVSGVGRVPHAAALGQLLSSDAVAILLGGDRFAPSELPAKLFESLFARKPILAVAKPGELWRVLAESGAGIAVPPGDPAALQAALARLCRDLAAEPSLYQADPAYVERFNRRALVGRFGAVLDSAAAVAAVPSTPAAV